MDRKIIFKCRTGSHLYGTNRPDSDEDYQGIFLPTKNDLLSLFDSPDEIKEDIKLSDGARNTTGDVDCKFYSLRKFLKLLAQGQPGQLEMLHAPSKSVLIATEEWQEIVKNKESFITKNSVSPFLAFALAQSFKAVIKGENLIQIQEIIQALKDTPPSELKSPLSSKFTSLNPFATNKGDVKLTDSPNVTIKWYKNNFGFALLKIAGRDFDVNISIKDFLVSLRKLESRYGSRVEQAANQGYDYKSLGHAVRLIEQAEELLLTGKITLPRPSATSLKLILSGQVDPSIDWFDELQARMDHLKQNVEPLSTLPESVDMKFVNELYGSILEKYVLSGV